MKKLHILSGGAAQGLIKTCDRYFAAQKGDEIVGHFGAVGTMVERLRNGEAADLVILTSVLIDKLVQEALVIGGSARNLGLVDTALAVREGDPPAIATDGSELRSILLQADAIFVPDTKTSTAGTHVARILNQLGIADEVASRLRIHPNGATAMRCLAETQARRPIGCTQATEIIATNGIRLCGALPSGFDLATMYTAAITKSAESPDAARELIEVLTSTETRAERKRAGFVERPDNRPTPHAEQKTT